MSTISAFTFLLSLVLLVKALIQYQTDPTWWAYVPAYAAGAVVSIIARPQSSIWRILCAFAIVGGALETFFLWWSFRHVKGAYGLQEDGPWEARNLLPLSLGLAVSSTTRLATAHTTSIVQKFRSLLLLVLILGAGFVAIDSTRYLRNVDSIIY